MSHPSRVRELKHPLDQMGLPGGGSHPSRVRELKLFGAGYLVRGLRVAPLAGA